MRTLTFAASILLPISLLGAQEPEIRALPPHTAEVATDLRQDAMFPNNIYPGDVPLVTVENRGSLQQELDAHGTVRLMPGDYGPGPITLRSGGKIFGLPGTKLGRIVIEPGAVGALVSSISGNVFFPASDVVTRGNTVLRVTSITVQGGTLEDNLLVDCGSVTVDVGASGYLRNNRFIRAPGQMQGRSKLMFIADPQRPSTGNVFLWMNPVGNHGPTTEIIGVPDLTIAMVDAEQWSTRAKEPVALFVTGPMERLNIFAVQGGRYDKDEERRKRFGLIDTAAREVRVFGLNVGYRGQSPDTLPEKIVLRAGNERSLFTDSLHYSMSQPAGALQVRASGKALTVSPAGAEHSAVSELTAMICQTGRRMVPWKRPVFEPVPDPAGKEWSRPVGNPDHTAMLQARLDKEGMVLLDSGTYYISSPLRINREKGLIGAGMDRTVIIAKDPGMSMFVYDPDGNTRAVTLANLTLQGGNVGLHLRGEDLNTYINRSFLSHLTFRDMTEAGIFVDIDTGRGSVDNNLITACNFVRCGTGLKLRPHPSGRYGFIDKLVMLRCRFIECGIGIDLSTRRGNNACAYIECEFTNNSVGAVRLHNNVTTLFANCDFVGNAGDPVVASNRPVYFLGSRFSAGAAARSLLPSRSIAEGCEFKSAPADTAVVVGRPVRNQFYNCRIEMPLGSLKDALFLNSLTAGQSDLSQVAAQVVDGKTTVLIPGPPDPRPQLLVTDPDGTSSASNP